MRRRTCLARGRKGLHFDLRATLHDNRRRTSRARRARCWRKHDLGICRRCGNGQCRWELRHHHDYHRVYPIERTPTEKWLPRKTMTTTQSLVATETVGSRVAAAACVGVHGKGYESQENAGEEKLPHLSPVRSHRAYSHSLDVVVEIRGQVSCESCERNGT